MSWGRLDEPRPMRHASRRRGRILVVALGSLTAVAIAVGLVAWIGLGVLSPTGRTASPASAPPTAATDSAAADKVASDPATGGSATTDDSLARFAKAVDDAVARSASANGARLRSSLAAAGYDASRIEYTADRTSVGLTASAVTLAYRDSDTTCLIAQVQTRDRTTTHQARAPIQSGTCLIGRTATSAPH